MTPLRLFSAAALLAALSLAPSASAQVVFDDFDDGDVTNVNAFFGGDMVGAGVGPTDGQDGQADAGLNLGVDPGNGGGFAGASVESAGAVDASAAEFLTFYVRPTLDAANLPLSLQVVLQEDTDGDGAYNNAVDDEFFAGVELSLDGNATWQLVEIPLDRFIDRNFVAPGANDGFDYSAVKNVVFVLADMPAGPGFAVSFDDIIFTDAPSQTVVVTPTTTFDDFDDGDVTNVNAFFGGDMVGAGVGPTDGQDGQADAGLNLGVDPGNGGGFAGASVESAGAVDASAAEFLTFYVRPTLDAANLPLSLQVVLQEDTDGDGAYNNAVDDEFFAGVELSLDGNATWQLVEIPLDRFIDRNFVAPGANDGFDYSAVKNVVFVLADMPAGPGFAVSFDDIAFGTGAPVANELPPSLADAPLAFPNPTAGAATVAFTLAEAGDVSVDVFDVLGRRVATLADGSAAAGPVRLDVPAGALAPGTYVVRVLTDAGAASTRLTVTR